MISTACIPSATAWPWLRIRKLSRFRQSRNLRGLTILGSGRFCEGGGVQFNGIPVGEITRISLDPRNPNRVLAGVRLREDTPVRVDSTAATESQGITGGSYIQISAGTPSKPLLKEGSKETLQVIKAE